MNFIVGFILLVSDLAPEEEVFWFFCILMSKYELHGFFRERFPLLGVYVTGETICLAETGLQRMSSWLRCMLRS